MKKLICSTIIAILLAGIAYAVSLSNVAWLEKKPVKIADNHVAIGIYGYDKNGKRQLLDYEDVHYGYDKAMAKWADANDRLTNWSDPNWVTAHVIEQITNANDDVTKYQAILDKF